MDHFEWEERDESTSFKTHVIGIIVSQRDVLQE